VAEKLQVTAGRLRHRAGGPMLVSGVSVPTAGGLLAGSPAALPGGLLSPGSGHRRRSGRGCHPPFCPGAGRRHLRFLAQSGPAAGPAGPGPLPPCWAATGSG
jgi:hypothetical protein